MQSGRCTSRREFLKTGAAALAAAALPSALACSRRSDEEPQTHQRIVYRTLGRTGLRLPVVSMGTGYGMTLIRAALEAGVVYLHTSSSYAERRHEQLLGRALRDLPRESFVLGTSPDLPCRYDRGRSRSNDLETNLDPELISTSIEGSLQRLGLDFVDIYYLLSVGNRETVLHEPYLRAFEQLKRDGKVRFVGVGTHANEPEVIRAVTESRFWDVVLTAYNFRQSHRDEIRDAIREAARAGVGVLAMKTQAGVYWDRARTRQINMKAALKWVLEDENVCTTIPAFSNFDEMHEDLSIMQDLSLTPSERHDLRLGKALGLPGLYCQHCENCLDQCSSGVHVPSLMRSCMYALGYGDLDKARSSLHDLSPTNNACTRCSNCQVHCALGLDVRASALDLAQLFDERTTTPRTQSL